MSRESYFICDLLCIIASKAQSPAPGFGVPGFKLIPCTDVRAYFIFGARAGAFGSKLNIWSFWLPTNFWRWSWSF